ncbi:hypothetical protein Q7P35_010953 [Cladosporium inversicolor]
MHFVPTALALLSLATSLQVLAAPLTFADIERRWSAGESDASIHALHNPRSASPAWPLAARSTSPESSSTFAESYDAVTQQGLIGKRSRSSSSNSNNAALMARIRDYATRLLRSKGEKQMIEERSGSEEVAPVLRPRKVVYRFSS